MKSVCYRERRQSANSYPCIWPNITSAIKILLYLNKLLCLRINIFDILFTAFTMFYCVFHVLKLFAYIVDVDKLDLFKEEEIVFFMGKWDSFLYFSISLFRQTEILCLWIVWSPKCKILWLKYPKRRLKYHIFLTWMCQNTVLYIFMLTVSNVN